MSIATCAKPYSEFMQDLADEYLEETGKSEATTDEFAVWAIRAEKWEPPPDIVLRKCKDDFADALRAQHITNDDGQPVRAKHAARRKVGTKQLYFWADIRNTTRKHIVNAFSLRRGQIVGDCRQLDRDKDYWNSEHPGEKPIQLVFDFSDDIDEGKYPDKYPPRKPR